jgi:hypothetical protein
VTPSDLKRLRDLCAVIANSHKLSKRIEARGEMVDALPACLDEIEALTAAVEGAREALTTPGHWADRVTAALAALPPKGA